jgi:hypothetical protein
VGKSIPASPFFCLDFPASQVMLPAVEMPMDSYESYVDRQRARRQRQRRKWGRFGATLAIGCLVGVGAGLGAAFYSMAAGDPSLCICYRFLGGPVGGLLGALAGYALAFLFAVDRWNIRMEDMGIRIIPRDPGELGFWLGLGISILMAFFLSTAGLMGYPTKSLACRVLVVLGMLASGALMRLFWYYQIRPRVDEPPGEARP